MILTTTGYIDISLLNPTLYPSSWSRKSAYPIPVQRRVCGVFIDNEI